MERHSQNNKFRNRRELKNVAEQPVTNQELVTKGFGYLNAFKRHRALEQISRLEGNREDATYHCLKQYQFIDSLELSLRAIQKGIRVEELETAEEG